MDYTLQLIELAKAHPILACLILTATVLVLQSSFGGITIPSSIPWVYKPSGIFAGFRAGVSGFIDARTLHQDGYEKVSIIVPADGIRTDSSISIPNRTRPTSIQSSEVDLIWSCML